MKLLNFFSYEGIQWQFTIALAPWQGRFYERLIGMVKKSLRKGMDRKLLYWDKLTTLLAEMEAFLNTRPLKYVYEEFSSGFVLTPVNFLIGDCNNVLFSTDDIEDEMEYLPKVDSGKELLLYWKKNSSCFRNIGHKSTVPLRCNVPLMINLRVRDTYVELLRVVLSCKAHSRVWSLRVSFTHE